MPERLCEQKPSSSSSCLYLMTLFQSLLIFSRNKRTFFYIFALLTLPLSFLLFSLSFSSHPIKSQILHLEAIAALSFTPFEARHVLKESRDNALSLLYLKLLYFVPSYPLSLLAAITTVVSADSAFHHKPITLKAAFAAVTPTWTRPLATSICIYAILLLYSTVHHTLTIIAGPNPGSRLAIWVIGLIVEFYIMAVLGMGLVVSVVERRFGWDAIRGRVRFDGGEEVERVVLVGFVEFGHGSDCGGDERFDGDGRRGFGGGIEMYGCDRYDEPVGESWVDWFVWGGGDGGVLLWLQCFTSNVGNATWSTKRRMRLFVDS